jgi:hypothetical protein
MVRVRGNSFNWVLGAVLAAGLVISFQPPAEAHGGGGGHSGGGGFHSGGDGFNPGRGGGGFNPGHHDPGHHDPGHHDPGHHDPGHHDPGHHDPGHHDPGHHDPGHHDPGHHDPGHHDPGHGGVYGTPGVGHRGYRPPHYGHFPRSGFLVYVGYDGYWCDPLADWVWDPWLGEWVWVTYYPDCRCRGFFSRHFGVRILIH